MPSPADMTSRRARRLAGVLVSLLALGFLAAACDGGDDEAGGDGASTTDPATTTADPTTTEATTTTLTPEDEVLTTYRAASQALNDAYDPPDPNNAGLLAHFSGEALARAQSLLTQLQAQGVSYVGTVEVNPTLVSLVGDAAVIEDCYVDVSQTIQTSTRAPVGDPEQTVGHIESHLERINGTWMIVREQELTETCTPG
jgi:hypothetical protein